mgnify:CR=1 FL=1
MVNSEIHIACVSNDIKKYRIAEKLGITDTSFSRKLRTELKEEEKEKMPEKYETVSLDDFVKYSKSMFEYWTEDDFASSFRKMLTIEQFRSEEMQNLYQQYLVAGPASYVKDLFESIGIANAKDKAAGFYAVMYFYYSMYDGAEDKQNVKDEFVSAIKSLVQELK